MKVLRNTNMKLKEMIKEIQGLKRNSTKNKKKTEEN